MKEAQYTTSRSLDIVSKAVIIALTVLTIVLALLILVPFFWLITSSLKTNREYFIRPIVWFSATPQWKNYYTVFIEQKFYTYILNSLTLAAIVVLFSIFSSAIVAYGFSRFKFKGRAVWFTIMLATMMLPGQVTMIPSFLFFKGIGWTNTILPLTVPQLCGSAGSVLLISQFIKSIPKAMDEAAKIDGASYMRVFFKIILPQIVPILVVVGIFTFLGSWKDSMGPLIYLTHRSQYTVPIALMFFQGDFKTDYGLLLTGITIALIPTLIIYIFGQKQIENNIVIVDLK